MQVNSTKLNIKAKRGDSGELSLFLFVNIELIKNKLFLLNKPEESH